MKVGFQSAVIDDNQTGLGTYARNLLASFADLKKMDQVYTIHYASRSNGYYSDKHEVIIPKYPFSLSKILGITAAIKTCNPDILHFPVHRCDDFLSYFLNADVNKVLTIHDLTPFFYKDQRDFQTWYLWVPMLKIAHKKNVYIITDSEQTRKDCEKYLYIPPEKIRVIPLSVDPAFRQRADKDLVRSSIALKFGIRRPFIFYTGSLLSRKNIRRLIEAFIILKQKNFPHLLVIGGSKKPYPRDLVELIKREKHESDILFIDYLSQDDLIDMYNVADIFAYPSLYEGFGLPPLEAMACGTPVVTSNTSSLPEVVGDAGITVNPYDTKELAGALEELILDESYRNELSKKGIARSRMFSWRRTGQETWDVYEEAMKKSE